MLNLWFIIMLLNMLNMWFIMMMLINFKYAEYVVYYDDAHKF